MDKCPVDHTVSAEAKCPVDHEARAKWQSLADLKSEKDTADSCPVDHSSRTQWQHMAAASGEVPIPLTASNKDLSTEREMSSIPRASTGTNWVYPSEKMFFEAMRRKKLDPQSADMKTIIPIHNAVNERSWNEILRWEHNQGADKCGGLKLVRFAGDASKLTPKAYWNMLWGGTRPFDRHDWVVDRCGREIDYVIDFYTGAPNPLIPEMPSFYIDARPKLNSIEGCRLRALKFLGLL